MNNVKETYDLQTFDIQTFSWDLMPKASEILMQASFKCYLHMFLLWLQDHMWQHKQEERELKRVEGDIIKNQRTVRRSLRDYENGNLQSHHMSACTDLLIV